MRGGRGALPAEKPTKLAASNRPKRELAVRVARADKVDNKLKAQLKQAKASGNLKKEYETIFRMQRVNRFNQTYNLADLKASRRALTPVNPTRTKGSKASLPRTPGTVAKAKRSPVMRATALKPQAAGVKVQSGPPGNPLGGKRSVKKLASVTAKSGTMKPPVTLKGLIRAGGNRWQKNQMDRVYFNNLGSRSGLDVDYYKSGNISSAAVQGKGISNSRAREVVANLKDAKLFYDRQTRSMNLKMTRNPSVRLQQFRTAEKLAKQDMKKIEKSARMKTKRQRKTNNKKPG
jgi:hypothetical protein